MATRLTEDDLAILLAEEYTVLEQSVLTGLGGTTARRLRIPRSTTLKRREGGCAPCPRPPKPISITITVAVRRGCRNRFPPAMVSTAATAIWSAGITMPKALPPAWVMSLSALSIPV